MAISRPEGAYTSTDTRLIQLLARLLSETPDEQVQTNAKNSAVLTQREVEELVALVESKLEDREFYLASALVEAISSRQVEQVRELFLSGRTRTGHTRALASKQHAEFLARLGLQDRPSGWYASADEMSREHFLRMERKLFGSLGVSPRVTEMAIRYISLHLDEVDQSRRGEAALPANFLKQALRAVASGKEMLGGTVDRLIDREQLVGVLTVVTNVGILYTTRDWSVTGTMSTIAGGLALLAPKAR
jgi:hypothetical protein